MMLAFTWQDFQSAALAFLAVMAVLVPAFVAAIIKVLPSIATLVTQIQDLKARLDRHETRQNAQDNTVAQIALAVQPPAKSAPVQPGN